MPTQYWRITSGSDGRDYSKYFLKHEIAFVGEEFKEIINGVKVNDIVVFTSGNKIEAAGLVTQAAQEINKEWLEDFDGWILTSYCHVAWRVPIEQSSLGWRGRTICRIHKKADKDIADEILENGDIRPPCREPQEVRKVEVDEILNFLEDEMKASPADELKNAISRIQSLAEHYFNNHWGKIREHETRTFLVIPLLLALGWKEEQIKIEFHCSGGKVDIACFRENYTGQDVDECVAIIETKSFHIGLDYAIGQINEYVKADREYFRNCETAIVTNGHCYKVHLRNGDEDAGFKKDPAAYMNIREPKAQYPLDPSIEGTLEVIRWLLPNSYFG